MFGPNSVFHSQKSISQSLIFALDITKNGRILMPLSTHSSCFVKLQSFLKHAYKTEGLIDCERSWTSWTSAWYVKIHVEKDLISAKEPKLVFFLEISFPMYKQCFIWSVSISLLSFSDIYLIDWNPHKMNLFSHHTFIVIILGGRRRNIIG